MAEPGRNSSASEISENIGDVLASIRRLIAQDEENRSQNGPANRLRELASRQAAAGTAPPDHNPPLVLRRNSGAETVAGDPAPIRAQSSPGPIRLRDPATTPAAAPAQQPMRSPMPPERIGSPAFQTPPLSVRMAPVALPPAPVESETSVDEQLLTDEPFALDPPEASPPFPVEDQPMPTPEVVAAPALATAEQPQLPELAAPPEELHLFALHPEESARDTLLRDLIREAIRSELQGELGGQFSRNLRRVIRSEIDLALVQIRKGG